MGLDINALLSFARGLRSLAQQIDSLASQGSQAGSQNTDSFSTLLNSARDELASAAQSSQSSPAQLTSGNPSPGPVRGQATPTLVTADAQLPNWLTSAQARYEANKAAFSANQVRQRARWENNQEALRKFQETYHPDTTVRQEAVAWLEENMGTGWRASTPHIMETGKLLGEPLPDYLQAHYERYRAMRDLGHANSERRQVLWENNPEALRKIQETYHPDTTVRQEAVAWLEENMGTGWRATAPHVMETARLLAEMGEPSSDAV